MFFGSLCLHVGTHRLRCCATYAAHEVRAVPERRLAEERRKVFGKSISGASGDSRLKVVNQNRNIESRMDIDQQWDMIRLAAALPYATLGGEDLSQGDFEVLK